MERKGLWDDSQWDDARAEERETEILSEQQAESAWLRYAEGRGGEGVDD